MAKLALWEKLWIVLATIMAIVNAVEFVIQDWQAPYFTIAVLFLTTIFMQINIAMLRTRAERAEGRRG